MRNWEKNVKNYIKVCRARGIAESSINGKESVLYSWGHWLRMRKPMPVFDQVSTDPKYSINYIKSKGIFKAKSTISSIMSVMRCFGRYLVDSGEWQENPLQWIEGPRMSQYRKLPRRISRSTLKKVLQGAAEIGRKYDQLLMLASLTILYSTGIRKGEFERLRVQDWDRAQGHLKIDGSKSNKERIIPVPEIVYLSIEGYLPQRHNKLLTHGKEHESLFVNKNGDPLKGHQMATRLARLCKRLGLDHITPHQFRHSCASDLLEGGASIVEVRNILGHSSIGTTYRYTAISDPERKKAISRHPINRMLNTHNKES